MVDMCWRKPLGMISNVFSDRTIYLGRFISNITTFFLVSTKQISFGKIVKLFF